MKYVDSWWWPDHEAHMPAWMREPKNRVVINDRPAYQGKKQQAVLKHCGSRGRVAVDIGAHVGLWSFNLAHAGFVVFAFEPVADHRECWRKNMSGIEFATLYPYALGEKADMVNIRVNPVSTGDSWVKGAGDIEMRTLDSMQIPDVDLIKVDAEGYEELILRGAANTISADKPIICVEQKRDMATKFGLKPQGAVEYLRKTHGYRVLEEIGGDYIMGRS
jgi:FkbM family methyltransferase